MALNLKQAFGANAESVIAFIGSGGKTSAMFQLARQFDVPVWVTTTTHLGETQVEQADQHIRFDINNSPDLSRGGITVFTQELENDRWRGLAEDQIDWLFQQAKQAKIPLLIEADGSRGRPLKAPADHEPVIPPFVTDVVHVVGLRGVGQNLTAETVHRPELFSDLSEIKIGDLITLGGLQKVLTHRQGGLKWADALPAVRKMCLLNQADDDELAGLGHHLAQNLLGDYDAVVITSLATETVWAVKQPIAGIILAAGGSSRLGEPKQLLEWRGESFLRVVTKTALHAGLSPLVVVLGANQEKMIKELEGLNIVIAENPDWNMGQSTSVRAGLNKLPKQIGGAVFLLVDQPQIPPELIRGLVELQSQTGAPITMPLSDGRRANPVLFSRATFSDLKQLTGDQGGRQLFQKYDLSYLTWVDISITLDVDTLEDYSRLLNYE